jgi:ubiquinone/menaquinone biosynthesis C-methylase UbiE
MEQKNLTELHEQIPPGYYEISIKKNPFQRFWHLQRFRNVSQLVEKTKGDILDIGCADGTFTKIIFDKAKPRKIIGIDIVKSSIDYARKKFKKNKKMKFLLADGLNLPFGANSFEAVFALEVVEHCSSPQKLFSEAKRVLKPGGYLIVLVPTDNFLFKILWWIVLKTWGKHWRHTHIQSFNSKNSISLIIKNAGFEIEKDKKFLLGMLEVVKARKVVK